MWLSLGPRREHHSYVTVYGHYLATALLLESLINNKSACYNTFWDITALYLATSVKPAKLTLIPETSLSDDNKYIVT
jgi:hypothetical protein